MARIFNWEGFQDNNERNGMIDAANRDAAISQLEKEGIMVTSITEMDAGKSDTDSSDLGDQYNPKKIKNIDKVVFTKKLATMIKSGLPIMKTLAMLEEQAEKKDIKIVAQQIKSHVESGATLSEAFELHDQVFDSVYINLLKAGESSGKLTVFLEKLVTHLEKIEKIRRKVKGALMYPSILLCVAISVIMVMLIKVVPVFQQMFSSMGHDLPAPTQMIVNISEFLRDPTKGGFLFLGFILIFVIFRSLRSKNENFNQWFDKKILRIPLIGDVIVKSSLSKIAMISANLSAAGVSVIETLNIVAKSVTNRSFIKAFIDIKKGISEGQNLSVLYSQNEIFPPTFYQMIQVGEETGRLDEMLESIAAYYEEEFDLVVDRLTELLEPIMIVFMGLTVGFIIVAMYMPIFEIGKVVSG